MFQRVGQAAYKADLSNTIALCKALGNPEKGFRAIHIAGTNGKGSVSHFLASILQSAGYKTGLFTSPHYLDFRERIKINGQMIGEEKVLDFVITNTKIFEEIKPSFFEMSAALAFQYFADEKVDIAVIETGMGGRLDSTNVLEPELSIITNIGKDHTQFLGDTLAKIAVEKAGIIKSKVPVVIGESQEETNSVFTAKAKSTNSEILFADSNYHVSLASRSLDPPPFLTVTVKSKNGLAFSDLNSGLTGNYQLKNIATVLQSVQVLQRLGFNITEKDIHHGLENVVEQTQMLGRWQVLSNNPLIICDAAHNAHGLRYVMEQLRNMSFQKLHLVFGTVNDKDVNEILELLPAKATYYFCKASVPRALDPKSLKRMAEAKGLVGLAYSDVTSALKAAKEKASKQDVIFSGGSTFVVADTLSSLYTTK